MPRSTLPSMSDRLYAPRLRPERLIAAGRVVLAVSSLFAVWLDVDEPVRYAPVAYGVLLGYMLYAVAVGAQGVVLKDMAPQLLVDAVREVYGGGQWLEQGLGGRALRTLLMREKRSSDGARLLSSREREIVRLAVDGLRNRAIADRLWISEGTVKVHMHNIYDKLDVNGRIELANYARDNGLI